MKKLSCIFLSSLFLLGTSCSSDDDIMHATAPVFTAETASFGADSRTSMDANRNILWSEKDQISVFVKSTANQQYELSRGAGTTTGDFTKVTSNVSANVPGESAGTEIGHNVAVYPYAAGYTLKNVSAQSQYVIDGLTIPVEQTYVANSFGKHAFPMITVIDNNVFKFKNVGGMIKFQLKGDFQLKTIEVTEKGGQKVSGKGAVTVGYDGMNPSLAMDAAMAQASATLDCGEGIQLNETTATTFFVSLAPTNEATGFTVKLTDVNGGTAILNTKVNDQNKIVRNMILVMPELTCHIGQVISDIQATISNWDDGGEYEGEAVK